MARSQPNAPDRRDGGLRDPRSRMIDETSAFLSWALNESHRLPRIPRARVDDGGFADMLNRPGAKAMVNRWWSRVFQADFGQW